MDVEFPDDMMMSMITIEKEESGDNLDEREMKNKQRIFDDSQDNYYRPKWEYKVDKMFFGNEKRFVAKKSETKECR